METYLVGGAVRDEMLGRSVGDRDWVVVGSSPEEMAALGYRQVGRDFPVFLHPETHEEYALARTERKTGPGHLGFVCHAGPDVTLEDDLQRRDLTVNAMARSGSGALIDPFGGAQDLERKLLRHVSEAFREDPLRVFRVARFVSQLPGFAVADETLALMKEVAASDELGALSAERVFGELARALGEPEPTAFFGVLRSAESLQPWFAELDGVDLALPPGLVDPVERFAALGWLVNADQAKHLAERLKAPSAFSKALRQVSRYGSLLAGWRAADAADVVAAFNATRAFALPDESARLLRVVGACSGVDLSPLGTVGARMGSEVRAGTLPRGLAGASVGDALDQRRAALLRKAQTSG